MRSSCRLRECNRSLLIQTGEAERLGFFTAESQLLDFSYAIIIIFFFFFSLKQKFPSALWESDGGHPVVGAAALFTEKAQLVQSRILPGVCTGALK